MKESGWLTRSLEQNIPYNLDFPGKINNLEAKKAFLNILDDIERNNAVSKEYAIALMHLSIKNKNEKAKLLVNPINKESQWTISSIMEALNQHFYYRYKSRGASILPVIALYSIYQCMMNETKRFDGKKLDVLASHYSSDKNSGETGDIVVRNIKDGSIFEVVEVKFEQQITKIMVEDAYKKIYNKPIQRYYILSTKPIAEDEKIEIDELCLKARGEHGCQIITNGVLPTIKYYLRLLNNTDMFLENYFNNLANDSDINYEHKLIWNSICRDIEESKQSLT